MQKIRRNPALGKTEDNCSEFCLTDSVNYYPTQDGDNLWTVQNIRPDMVSKYVSCHGNSDRHTEELGCVDRRQVLTAEIALSC